MLGYPCHVVMILSKAEKNIRERELNQAIALKLVGVIGTLVDLGVIILLLIFAWRWHSYGLLAIAIFQALALPNFIKIWKSTWGIKGIDLLRELKALRKNEGTKKDAKKEN